MLGIRASESLTRFRSVVNKLNENYICACECDRVKIVKPIYDWEENDIFKFFHDERLPYCELYDWQHLDGTALRVATPLHSEASKTIDRWRRLDPDFYQRVMAVFPEMAVQERYWNDYDRYKLIQPYKGRGWEGVEAYIDEHVEDGTMREQCLDRLREFKSLGERQADTYNPDFLLKCIVSGSIKRTIIGSRKKK